MPNYIIRGILKCPFEVHISDCKDDEEAAELVVNMNDDALFEHTIALGQVDVTEVEEHE